MGGDQRAAAGRAARAYSAAADHYLLPALGFWDRFGVLSVRRIGLLAGDRVLDVCCGAGSSAIPAAHAVGPSGHVLGIDLAEPLLAHARQRAARETLSNIEFRAGDATDVPEPDASFDAVLCVFGVFFAADMPAFVAEMWRLLRPGGHLAITTWGPGLFEPASTVFWDAVAQQRPDLVRAFNPWDQLTTPHALATLMRDATSIEPVIEEVADYQQLSASEQFWDLVLGSGYRATVDAMTPDHRSALRSAVLAPLQAQHITRIRTDALLARAQRPV
jgi:ubiquinone/menaquinone biosynthesis C-methylase UbiE